VKPANILLENGVERVKLTDFGLARTIDDASLTQSGVLAGTPQYMAPEQARGESVDHRSDLFSLGSVLYAMCTGHSPFRAETMVAVIRRLCDEPPRPIREVNPDIPDWFAEIVSRLHEKRSADRFTSAEEVADLLSRHLAYLQQPAVYVQPARLVQRRHATHPSRRVALATLLFVTIGVGIASVGGLIGDRHDATDSHESDAWTSARAGSANAPSPPGLAEWNLFERELEETRSETAEVERQVRRFDDAPHGLGDTIPVVEAESKALERLFNALGP
jgi:serine/threonine protein kinase